MEKDNQIRWTTEISPNIERVENSNKNRYKENSHMLKVEVYNECIILAPMSGFKMKLSNKI